MKKIHQITPLKPMNSLVLLSQKKYLDVSDLTNRHITDNHDRENQLLLPKL